MPGPGDFTAEELQILRPLFVSSAREHLEAFAGALRDLGGTPHDQEQLELLQRSVHSVKGAAFQLGAVHIGALAKAMEDVAKGARQAGCAPGEAESGLLAEGRQMLLAYLAAFERGEEDPEAPADLLGRLGEAARTAAAPDERERASGE
jgi:chemotaxis protein histidine kinase CheA